jgi:hypothetical protein
MAIKNNFTSASCPRRRGKESAGFDRFNIKQNNLNGKDPRKRRIRRISPLAPIFVSGGEGRGGLGEG